MEGHGGPWRAVEDFGGCGGLLGPPEDCEEMQETTRDHERP